jgi:uncharacterized protein YacL
MLSKKTLGWLAALFLLPSVIIYPYSFIIWEQGTALGTSLFIFIIIIFFVPYIILKNKNKAQITPIKKIAQRIFGGLTLIISLIYSVLGMLLLNDLSSNSSEYPPSIVHLHHTYFIPISTFISIIFFIAYLFKKTIKSRIKGLPTSKTSSIFSD